MIILMFLTFFLERRLQTERSVYVAEDVAGYQVPDDDFAVVTRSCEQVWRRYIHRQDVVLVPLCLYCKELSFK